MLDPRKRRHDRLPVVFPDVGAGNDEAAFTDAGVGEPSCQLTGQPRGDENRVGASRAFNVYPCGLHGLSFEGSCCVSVSVCGAVDGADRPLERRPGGSLETEW